MSLKAEQLSIWTVYEHPQDQPEKFVARRWIATPEPKPTDDVFFADDLEGLRQQLPPGLARIARQAGDDPVIVESWI